MTPWTLLLTNCTSRDFDVSVEGSTIDYDIRPRKVCRNAKSVCHVGICSLIGKALPSTQMKLVFSGDFDTPKLIIPSKLGTRYLPPSGTVAPTNFN